MFLCTSVILKDLFLRCFVIGILSTGSVVAFYLSSRGSAISKIIGANCALDDDFDTQVNMYVYEEMIKGKKLTEIINTQHENVKYLPGHKIPKNVASICLICFYCNRLFSRFGFRH